MNKFAQLVMKLLKRKWKKKTTSSNMSDCHGFGICCFDAAGNTAMSCSNGLNGSVGSLKSMTASEISKKSDAKGA